MAASPSPADPSARQRWLALLLLGVTVAASAYVLLRVSSPPTLPLVPVPEHARESDAGSVVEPDAALELASAADAAATAPFTPLRLDAAAAEREARRAAGPRTATATPGETIVARAGRVVLLDVAGRKLDAPDGVLDLFYWRGSYGEEERGVEVVDGRFTLQAPSLAKTFDVQRAEFEGAPAWVEARDLPLDGGGELVVHAQMRRRTRLLVVADESGEPLRDVSVLDEWLATAEESELQMIGRGAGRGAAIELRRRSSPITLPDLESLRIKPRRTLTVSAPGRATVRIEVDFAAGGDTTVRLPAGAELVVTLPVIDPSTRATEAAPLDASGADWIRTDEGGIHAPRLELRGPDREWVCYVRISAHDATEQRIAGLSPGRYHLLLWVDDAHGPRIAEQLVDLEAGRTKQVEFAPPVARPPEFVPLAGKVVLPPATRAESIRLRFVLTEPDAPRDGVIVIDPRWQTPGSFTLELRPGARRGRDVLPFDAGLVRAGRWRVLCLSPALDVKFDTGPHGRRDLHLEVEVQLAVEIALIDGATGGPCGAIGTVGWCALSPGNANAHGPWKQLQLDERSTARGALPPGRIDLRLVGTSDVGYALPDPCIVTVAPDQTRFELAVQRRPALTLRLRVRGEPEEPAARFDGRSGAPPTVTLMGAVALRCLDAPEIEPPPSNVDSVRLAYGLPRAGRWRVEFTAPDGFEQPANFDVQVGEGEWLEREIELVRK